MMDNCVTSGDVPGILSSYNTLLQTTLLSLPLIYTVYRSFICISAYPRAQTYHVKAKHHKMLNKDIPKKYEVLYKETQV